MEKQTDLEIGFPQQKKKGFALDIHKEKIVACVHHFTHGTKLAEFGTLTKDLEQLRDWLKGLDVKEGAMESTGIYWRPIYSLLEEAGFSLYLVNAQYIRQIPGRKTDINDAQWICKLLLSDLLKGSYIPPSEQREIRALCRQRSQYIGHRSQALTRMLKVLEGGNIKLRSVISNIHSTSGLSITRALAKGQTDPDQLSNLLKGRARKKMQDMKEALRGKLTASDKVLLGLHLKDYDHLEEQLCELDKLIDDLTSQHYKDKFDDLEKIWGVGKQSAQTIISEAGPDMQAFPSENHFVAWAGLSPGNHESADKRRSVGLKPGNQHLRKTFVQIAWVSIRQKGSYWRAMYQTLTIRMNRKKAIIAIARKISIMIYRVLKKISDYRPLNDSHFFKKTLNLSPRS